MGEENQDTDNGSESSLAKRSPRKAQATRVFGDLNVPGGKMPPRKKAKKSGTCQLGGDEANADVIKVNECIPIYEEAAFDKQKIVSVHSKTEDVCDILLESQEEGDLDREWQLEFKHQKTGKLIRVLILMTELSKLKPLVYDLDNLDGEAGSDSEVDESD